MLQAQGGFVLDVRRLVLLAKVLDTGSMTAAAEAMHYSPSAVSQQLRRLEAEVGQPLLQRRARGVTPTEAGAALAEHARRVARQLAAAEADVEQIAGLRRGRLDIGTFPTIGSSLLPLAVSRYRNLYPGIRLNVFSSRLEELVEMLYSGDIGLSLLWDYAWNRISPSAFVITHLFDDPTALVVAADHRVARRRHVKMSELADEDWIVRAHDHPVGEILDRACHAAGYAPRIAFHANDYQEAQAMVSVGIGIALAPRTAVTNKRPDVRIISLGSTAPSRRILLAYRHGRVRAAADEAMGEVLVEVARDYQRDTASR
jgi:DNA-binding transcriptional LysR family regulator